ncbi:MAG: radical SAM protein, partial [Ignavibacteriales bacterium]|nr:radical SAM protein [Ignavibacteriales bacterium]
MRDILITHSYFLHFDPKEYRAMMPYPPLGTLYAASMLRKGGFDVAFHDTMLAHDEEEIRNSLQTHQPKIIVVYDDQFNYLTKMCLSRMRQAAFKIADIAKEYGCVVIVFSSDATDHLQDYFRHNIDFIICGEAEVTLCELADSLLHNPERTISSIHGIAYKEDGTIRQTSRRELMTKLDEIPFPSWDLVDIESYHSAWERCHGYYSVNVVTTRGCPFHCNWCAKPIYGQVYHSRSPENVVEELIYLKKTINPDHIWFVDDIFGLRPGWLAGFDEVINEHNVRIPFKCLSRADLLLKEDNIRHLKNSGCQTVWIGAESGSQKVLDAMEKGTTIEQIHHSTELLRKSKIRV